ncbi:FtsX-like permease family protein [Faecalibacillus faecis]|uniref:FtsX-like permease family protein n=1 Tax=Faecalibacillus faecis TaxID=1982628 RepID=UPI0022DF6BCB|nr:FtsX-like permease family protein [Faecalibacillus faecis]
MKVFSLATLTLKRNKKQYMIYGLTLIFAIVIHLIFSEFINNPYLIEADRARGIDDPNGADLPLSMGLPFLIILFCWFMIIYASQYFLNQKNQEFGILFTCGFNLLDFIKYTLIQMGVVFIFVLPISFILGVLSLFFIHTKIYSYLGINHSIYTIMPNTFLTTISALCVLVVIVIIFLIGQLHRSNIYTLMNDENKVQTIYFVSVKKMMMYLLIYLISFYSVLIVEENLINYIPPTALGVVGMYGLYKYLLPQIFLKNKKNLKGKQLYICLSHVGLMMKSTASLISLLTLLITVLLPVLASQNIKSNEFVTGMICYLFIVVMVINSILYKMNMEKKTKMKEFNTLNKVGYTKYDLKRMLLKENMMYFICILVIPLPYLIFIAKRFILMNSTMLTFYSGLFIYYVVTLFICFLLNYCVGKVQLGGQ